MIHKMTQAAFKTVTTTTYNCDYNHSHNQCDQIERFLKVLVAQKDWLLMVYFEKD